MGGKDSRESSKRKNGASWNEIFPGVRMATAKPKNTHKEGKPPHTGPRLDRTLKVSFIKPRALKHCNVH